MRIQHVLDASCVPSQRDKPVKTCDKPVTDRSFHSRGRTNNKLLKTSEMISGSHSYHEESNKDDVGIMGAYLDWGQGSSL